MTEPITRQVDVLVEIWREGGSVPLLPGYKGYQHVMAGGRTVLLRVWERLLERGDLDVVEDRVDPSRAPRKSLVLTRQGLARIV